MKGVTIIFAKNPWRIAPACRNTLQCRLLDGTQLRFREPPFVHPEEVVPDCRARHQPHAPPLCLLHVLLHGVPGRDGRPVPVPLHEADDVEREEAGPQGALDGRAEREARGIERAAERGPQVRDGDP